MFLMTSGLKPRRQFLAIAGTATRAGLFDLFRRSEVTLPRAVGRHSKKTRPGLLLLIGTSPSHLRRSGRNFDYSCCGCIIEFDGEGMEGCNHEESAAFER